MGNSKGQVRAIVNNKQFEQAVHQEICGNSETPRCHRECRCEQKYKWHRLWPTIQTIARVEGSLWIGSYSHHVAPAGVSETHLSTALPRHRDPVDASTASQSSKIGRPEIRNASRSVMFFLMYFSSCIAKFIVTNLATSSTQ